MWWTIGIIALAVVVVAVWGDPRTWGRGGAVLALALLVGCGGDKPTSAAAPGKAYINIIYKKGFIEATPATVEVNGGYFCTLAKNTEKIIIVDDGDIVRAEWIVYLPGGQGLPKSAQIIAETGEWDWAL
jgi:hypothetical protein